MVVWRPSDGRCLVLERSKNEVAHPSKFGVIGGKLEWKDLPSDRPDRVQNGVLDYLDAVEKLLTREVFEEADIEIETNLTYINSVAYIRPDGVPSILVKFAAKFKSGEVKIDEHDFDSFAWVNADEVKKLPTIAGINEEIAKACSILTN